MIHRIAQQIPPQNPKPSRISKMPRSRGTQARTWETEMWISPPALRSGSGGVERERREGEGEGAGAGAVSGSSSSFSPPSSPRCLLSRSFVGSCLPACLLRSSRAFSIPGSGNGSVFWGSARFIIHGRRAVLCCVAPPTSRVPTCNIRGGWAVGQQWQTRSSCSADRRERRGVVRRQAPERAGAIMGRSGVVKAERAAVTELAEETENKWAGPVMLMRFKMHLQMTADRGLGS
jgi:hypothetical protein